MSEENAQDQIPPQPGEKKTFTKSGKVYRHKSSSKDPYPTKNKAAKIADKLMAMQKEQEDAQKQEQAEAEPAPETEEGVQPESEPVQEQEGQADGGQEASPADVGESEPAGDAGAGEKDLELSPQFAALARAERRMRDQHRAQQEEIEKQRAELQQLAELKAIADKDKYQLLDHLGVDINEWAKRKLGKSDGAPEVTSEVSALIERIEAVEKRNKELEDQRLQQQQELQYQQIRQQSLADIGKILQDNSERYELTSLRGGAEVVFATIEEHYNNTGQLLDYGNAADLVEAHFEEEAKAYLQASKLKPKAPEKAEPKKQPSGSEGKAGPRKTITRTAAADRTSSTGLSKKERRQRAAAILEAANQQ